MKHAKFAFVLMLSSLCWVPGTVSACDVTTHACQQINLMLDRLQYRDALLAAQKECIEAAASKSPAALEKTGVLRALGIERKATDWPEGLEAFDKFVAVACGGEEIVQVLLHMYRTEWAQVLTSSDIQALNARSEMPPQGLRQKVSAIAGGKASTMISAMERTAMKEYEDALRPFSTKLKELAETCPNGRVDETTQTCRSDSRQSASPPR